MLAQYKKDLEEFIRFHSISTDSRYATDLEQTAKWLEGFFTKSGFECRRLEADGINPIIFAEYQTDPAAKTVLVYGHYDVQPAAESDGWASPPFDLTERDGRLWARGVVDNKGQVLIHMRAVADLIQRNELRYNVKFFVEGNEESGNCKMREVLANNVNLLECDHVLISDGQIEGDTPTIEASLRGGFNVTLIARTGPNALHSGLYGGAAPNAGYELSRLLGRLYDDNNCCRVPGFNDGVDVIGEETRAANRRFYGQIPDFCGEIGIKGLVTEPDTDPLTQIGLRPTIQVTGLNSGYTGTGYKNIVPEVAEARLNFRLVASQDPQQIFDRFEAFVRENLPDYVEHEISVTGKDAGTKIDMSAPIVTMIKELLESAFERKPFITYCGGSIPVVAEIKEELGHEALLVSLGNGDCNMHGVDENYRVDLIEKGLVFSRLFFSGSRCA